MSKISFKVCVCGASGGIGQPLSLLMAMDERVSELSLMDVNVAMVPVEGVAADLSHINTSCTVKGYSADVKIPAVDQLKECLTGCDLVLIPAGVPRKPGMTRADLFGINAGIAKGLAEATAEHCPNAVVAMIVNPVNSVVPAVTTLYKKWGKNPKKVLGVSTLDVVRAGKFVAAEAGKFDQAGTLDVPVIGGHAGVTILPLLSQASGDVELSQSQIESLDKRIQNAGTEVVEAKKGKGSATLSMAYAGARLGKAVLTGLAGGRAVECAYLATEGTVNAEISPYFASKVVFGKDGVEEVLGYGELTKYEEGRLAEVLSTLKGQIDTGLEYAAKF